MKRSRLFFHFSHDLLPSLRLKRQYAIQTPPKLENPLKADHFLRILLTEHLPTQVLESVSKDLEQFSRRITEEIEELGAQAELEEPTLLQYSGWGERVDEVRTSRAWKLLKRVSAQEGLVAIAYEREHGEYSRIHQAAKLHLFGPSSGLYNCPLAMTDGAARLIEAEAVASLMGSAFKRLTSRSPSHFWTSGQWMTEKMGGSDVRLGTESIAREQKDGRYRLYGEKWFTSAVDSDMAFTLARIAQLDESEEAELSLFYLETRLESGAYNGIVVNKLKDKLGTRQLPTAELTLDGTLAQLIGHPGRGVKLISHMLNVTRIHNALAATGAMRRIVQLACEYAEKRRAFGKPLLRLPLHARTLAQLEVRSRRATAFAMDVSRLLGLTESGGASRDDLLLLRLLTPLLKLYTAKEAVSVISEGLECFGGQGYIEETGLPRLLRDAQVLPIWEGTTNILSLDTLRVLTSTQGAASSVLIDVMKQRISRAKSAGPDVGRIADQLTKDLTLFQTFMESVKHESTTLETASRDIAFSLCNLYIASLFLDYSCSTNAHDSMVQLAKDAVSRRLVVLDGIRDYGTVAHKTYLQIIYPKSS